MKSFLSRLFNKKSQMVDKYAAIEKDNVINVRDQDKQNINISIRGKNNVINIKSVKFGAGAKINIFLTGDNNTINIDENILVGHNLTITVGRSGGSFVPVENVSVNIGRHTSFGTTTMVTYNSNTHINVGERCMFAFDVMVYNTDAHPIYDIETNKIINKVRGIDIGNHVWLAGYATVLKNSVIADDCVIGWGGVVAGRFVEPNCAIAGNPAHVVRKNIRWDSDGTKGYCQNILD